jgi:hypothetical protein
MFDIIIIGYSKKFINLIKSRYRQNKIYIIHWRNLVKIKNKKKTIIFICGFDYGSLNKDLNFFLQHNVYNIVKFIKFFKKIKKIFYFNTYNKEISKTYSRYNYAKNLLAYELQNNFQNTQIVSLPTITKKNEPLIYGNILFKLLFFILIKFNLIKNIEIKNILKFCKYNIKQKKIKKLKGAYLKIPRNIFFDRMLRFIFG